MICAAKSLDVEWESQSTFGGSIKQFSSVEKGLL